MRRVFKLISLVVIFLLCGCNNYTPDYKSFSRLPGKILGLFGNDYSSSNEDIPPCIVLHDDNYIYFANDFTVGTYKYKYTLDGSITSYDLCRIMTKKTENQKWVTSFITQGKENILSLITIDPGDNQPFSHKFSIKTNSSAIIKTFYDDYNYYILAKVNNKSYIVYDSTGKLIYSLDYKKPMLIIKTCEQDGIVMYDGQRISFCKINSKGITQWHGRKFTTDSNIDDLTTDQQYYNYYMTDYFTVGIIHGPNLALYNYKYNTVFFDDKIDGIGKGLAYQIFPSKSGNLLFYYFSKGDLNQFKYLTCKIYNKPYDMLYYERADARNVFSLYMGSYENNSYQLSYLYLDNNNDAYRIIVNSFGGIPEKINNVLTSNHFIYLYTYDKVYAVSYNDPSIRTNEIIPKQVDILK